jgi:hypothetical protein
MSFFSFTSPRFLSKPLNCKLIIKNNNMVVLINVTFLCKKIIINLIPKKLILYNNNFLCHHVKHILFYL